MIRTVTTAGLGAMLTLMLVIQPAEAQGPAGAARAVRVVGPVDNGLEAAWRNFGRRAPARNAANLEWGFRNPGHVGRMAEYYPPGDAFQNGGPHHESARFEQLPVATSRWMQLESQRVGIARYNAIQSHIDRYGTPRVGFGFGYGFGYGVGFGGYMGYPY